MDQEGARGESVVVGSLLAILLCALLVALCYFFVDRQVTWFVHDRVPGLIVIAGLVGMNYHFVGDTVGGAFVGSITGVFTVAMLRTPRLREQ